MPVYEITAGDGVKYKVESDSAEQASKDLAAHRQTEMNQKFTEEAKSAPEWAKPIIALQDAARVGQSTLSGGLLDRFADYMADTGDAERMKTTAAKKRMGFPGATLEAASIMGAFPSAVPKIVAATGGGPATRTITGAVAGGTEGGALGTVNAIGHTREGEPNNPDINKSATIGTIAGVLGAPLGALVNRATKAWDQFRGGVHDPAPYNLTKAGYDNLPRTPTRMDKINLATTEAEKAAKLTDNPISKQRAIQEEFAKLKPKDFTASQREELDRILGSDMGDKATRVAGNALTNKLAMATTTGAALGTGNMPGLLAVPAMAAGGNLLQRASLGGTKEAAQNLRRMVYGYPEFRGPVSPMANSRISNIMRQLGLEYNEE